MKPHAFGTRVGGQEGTGRASNRCGCPIDYPSVQGVDCHQSRFGSGESYQPLGTTVLLLAAAFGPPRGGGLRLRKNREKNLRIKAGDSAQVAAVQVSTAEKTSAAGEKQAGSGEARLRAPNGSPKYFDNGVMTPLFWVMTPCLRGHGDSRQINNVDSGLINPSQYKGGVPSKSGLNPH